MCLKLHLLSVPPCGLPSSLALSLVGPKGPLFAHQTFCQPDRLSRGKDRVSLRGRGLAQRRPLGLTAMAHRLAGSEAQRLQKQVLFPASLSRASPAAEVDELRGGPQGLSTPPGLRASPTWACGQAAIRIRRLPPGRPPPVLFVLHN